MKEKKQKADFGEGYQTVYAGEATSSKPKLKKKFLKRAMALQPVLLDPMNIQTGVAASIIVNQIEGGF